METAYPAATHHTETSLAHQVVQHLENVALKAAGTRHFKVVAHHVEATKLHQQQRIKPNSLIELANLHQTKESNWKDRRGRVRVEAVHCSA
jgi:hypothetical protein